MRRDEEKPDRRERIFRRVALDRLQSPERLDLLLEVTAPRSWLALVSLLLVLASALLWAFFGRISTYAEGTGILLRQGGVTTLAAGAQAQVHEVLVNAGEVVTTGQILMRLRQDEFALRLVEAEAKRAMLAAEFDKLRIAAGEQRRLSRLKLRQRRADLEQAVGRLEGDRALLSKSIETTTRLFDEGLSTPNNLFELKQHFNETEEKIAAARLESGGLELLRLETEERIDRLLEDRSGEVRDLDFAIARQRDQLDENREILAPFDGRILELFARPGDLVAADAPLLSLESDSEPLMAVIFVLAENGKTIRPGMRARVASSTVKRDSLGSIHGVVRWVADFPSTSRGMMSQLSNEDLVARLMRQGPPLQINVALEPQPGRASGNGWTSSAGPAKSVTSGTLVVGSVLVREERPISLVVPKLRKTLGL